MNYSNSNALVSAEWLKDNLSCPLVKVIDATWYLPNLSKNARTEYERCHIPRSVFFDIDQISDKSNSLPHMLPTKQQFSKQPPLVLSISEVKKDFIFKK